MKSFFFILFLFFSAVFKIQSQQVELLQSAGSHPSLLINAEDVNLMKSKIKTDKSLAILHQVIMDESDKILSIPPVEYVKIGRRLLSVSREALRRIFYLSYAYQLTNKDQYAKRAEAEMLAVCSFQDWNPSHFLDVAEMTMAVSIGYDWIFDKLSDTSRQIISASIIENGLKPSLKEENIDWVEKRINNWNQVCNASMTFGAIVTRDKDPELAQLMLNRSLTSILRSMKVYEPDGIYPEGYGYWAYGTTFNVMFISAIEKLYGTSLFPLADKPGFMKTASYFLHMMGPIKYTFDYSDTGLKGGINPAAFWFAQRNNDASLLWNEKDFIINDRSKMGKERFLPAAILWGVNANLDKISAPTANTFVGAGTNPVCMMRTSWTDSNAIYVGFKAGTLTAGHAHMDIGSFVMDANGERWASDFGMENYTALEAKGVDLWNQKQYSQRWKVFRLNNFSHNTLTFNDSLQRVTGYAKIDAFTVSKDRISASSDLSSIYKDQVKSVSRSISIENKEFVTVKDEIETLENPTKMRWTLLTEAKPVLLQATNTIQLSKNGKTLLIKINSSEKITLKTWSTVSPNDFDSPNPGMTLVGFEVVLPKLNKSVLTVSLLPQK